MFTYHTRMMAAALAVVVCLVGTANAQDNDERATNLAAFRAAAELQSAGSADVEESTGRIPTADALAMFESRVEANPDDFLSMTVLGQLYLRQAREADDLPFYAKAEETFRSALRIKSDHRSAMTFLAITLEARHQFSEALELSSRVAATSARETLALATMGDCQLHLGRYDEAAGTYKTLAERCPSPAVIARLAHLNELQGNPDIAITQITEALDLSRSLGSTGKELAWYEFRLGHLLLSQGKLSDSEEHFRSALSLATNYGAAQLGLAEVLALQGKFAESEQQYVSTIEQHGEPPAMAGLGDVFMKQGKTANAAEWYAKAEAKMEEEALSAAAAHYREVANFYTSHDLKPERALELAEMDLRQRQDIHAYDALAWALYRNRQFEKAHEAIETAMRLKTSDANMYFHAGMIYLAIGDSQNAKEALSRVNEINPRFSVLYGDVAAAELKKLQ